MVVNGLKFNCLTRWSLTQSLDHGKDLWPDVQKAMEGNTSVTDVYLGPYFYSSLTASELAAFLYRCAVYLTNLKVLSIGTLDFTKTPIEGASALSASLFLPTARQLCTLRIERNLLLRSPRDVQSLAAGFRNHPSLKRVSLPCLHPSWLLLQQNEGQIVDDYEDLSFLVSMGTAMIDNNLNGTCLNNRGAPRMKTLDPLLHALSTIVTLESLQLGLSDTSFECLQSMNRMDQVSSPAAFCRLGTLPCLSWLVLPRFHAKDAHVQALCQHISKADEDLTISAARIKVLDFTNNRHLTVLSWQAILHLLQTNVNLEALYMPCRCDDGPTLECKHEVEIFLKLNREGRRRKLRALPSDKEAWIDSVARYFINDLTALTVLVRDSPWICLPHPKSSNKRPSSSSSQSLSSPRFQPQRIAL